MARQTVLIIVDGLRYDTFLQSDVMPNLSKLRSTGAFAQMQSRPPSYSIPGYGVLLTGAWPEISGASAFNPAYEDIHSISQDNLFSSAHRLGLKTAISAYYWFEKLVPQDALDSSFYTAGEDKIADRDVVDAALPWLASADYRFLLIHLDQVDYAGHHEGGPENPSWNEAASRADDLIGEILANMDLKQDVVLIVSDHGHIDSGGHGGTEKILMQEPFLLAGKGVLQGDYGVVHMADVAPTLAAVLGINLPASSQGQVLADMLGGLPADTRSHLADATAKQQSQLLQKYADAIGAKLKSAATAADAQKTVADYQATFEKIRQSKITLQRVLRIGIALVGLLLIGFALIRWKFFNTGWLFFGAVLYTLFFHAYYLVFGMGHYSYSLVESQSSLILKNGLPALLILTLTWGLFTWRNRSSSSKLDLASFSGLLALVTCVLTFLPVAAHWVWDGMFSTWALPNLTLHYLAILSLIQIMFLGAGGLLLCGISFWLGAKNKTSDV
jgi:hypothetical protein